MNEKLKKDEAERQQVVLCKKRKRLLMLEELMQDNGLFTNAEEVQDFMEKDISESKKQARLKKEVKFARESSTTLPKVDSLFRIQVYPQNTFSFPHFASSYSSLRPSYYR